MKLLANLVLTTINLFIISVIIWSIVMLCNGQAEADGQIGLNIFNIVWASILLIVFSMIQFSTWTDIYEYM